MTRRRIRRFHAEAERAYQNGIYFDRSVSSAPSAGPLRIAFDAGRQNSLDGRYVAMSVDTWALVLADWLRGY